jgi:HAD superfamily hydrolase (TIGR01484 family)
MQPFDQCPVHQLAHIQGIFTDVDDTLTRHGKLAASTFAALHDLAAAGVAVIPITGGPASWADHMARVWPVTAAVGESGAVSYWQTPHGYQVLHAHDEPMRLQHTAQRMQAWQAVLERVPHARLAADQVFRLADLAIDYAQDARLPPKDVQSITAVLQAHGFTVRVSSIHINAWLGNYDKPLAACQVARACLGIDLLANLQHWLYVGDSRNDEGMFAQFPLSIGVANIAAVAPSLMHPPAYVTQASHGQGFEEVAYAVLTARQHTTSSPAARL